MQTVHDGQDGSDTFRPIFQFTASDGRAYTVTSDSGSTPAGFVIGQRVPALYRAGEPTGAKINSFWQLWTFCFVFGVMGLLATLVGAGLLWWERWRERRTVGFVPRTL